MAGDRKTGGTGWLWLGAAVVGAGAGAGLYALNRIGRGGEQPDHAMVEAEGPFSVRDYPALLVAQAEDSGGRADAVRKSFRRLADYLFAKARSGERIAMTSPVLTDAAGSRWRTRFILPARYTQQSAPAPQNGVALATVPARRVAALRFAGVADDAALAEREAELRAWMAARGLSTAGPAEYAFYDAPFVPGPIRRNEVLIPVSTDAIPASMEA